MKKSRFFALVLALCLTLALTPPARAVESYEADARAALLVDVKTGEILYEKNIHTHNYPASITKIMTALLVLEAIDAGTLRYEDEVTAQESAFEGLSSDGSTAGIKAGETLTVDQLLHCMLIVSANEACNILAEAVSGSVSAFVTQMNSRAESLGCEDTHFVNTSGLHSSDHYTSAWDIYLITREVMEYDKFMEICNSKSYEVPATNLSKARELHSTNYLISTWYTGWPGYYYEGARGIKTGSTPEAGRCLVSSAIRGDRELVSVVLGADRVQQADGTWLTKSFSETARLFDHGFDDFASMDLLSPEELIQEVPVELSSEANYVVVHPSEGLRRMAPVGLAPEDFTRTVELYQESVDAPVAEGDELGTITVSYGDTVYGTVPLLALNDVSASWLLIKQREAREFIAQPWVRLAAVGVVALAVGIIALRAVSVSRAKRYSGARRRGGYSYNGYRGKKKR